MIDISLLYPLLFVAVIMIIIESGFHIIRDSIYMKRCRVLYCNEKGICEDLDHKTKWICEIMEEDER